MNPLSGAGESPARQTLEDERMKRSISFVTFLTAALAITACGKDSDSESSDGIVVEVGDGQADLRLAETAMDSDGSVSEAEISQCGNVFAGEIESWKISGNQNVVDLKPTQAFATKITGNQNSLNLTIKAKEGEVGVVRFPGLCLVLGGNQPTVNLTLDAVSLDTLKIVARGNNGKINIKIQGDAAIPAGSVDDLGKHVSVNVEAIENDETAK